MNLYVQKISAEGQPRRNFTTAPYAFLKSSRLAIFLIVALAAALLASSIIPQVSSLTESEVQAWAKQQPALFSFFKMTGLSSIYSSWWLYALLALFLTNTLLCTIERVKYMLALERRWLSEPLSLVHSRFQTTTPTFLETSQDKALRAAEAALKSKRYNVIRRENLLFAGKNRWGNWGTVILHISLLVIIVGAIVGRATSMNGRVELVEGQRFFDTHSSYLLIEEGPLFNEAHTGFEVRLEKFEAAFWKDGSSRERISIIGIYENGQKVMTKTISPNYPASYKGRRIYQLSPFGYSAILTLGKPGEPGKIGWINFRTPQSVGKEIKDTFVMHGTKYRADVVFYPNYGGSEGQNPLKLERLKNPALLLTVFDTDTGKTVYKGMLTPGESINLGGEALTFLKVHHWTGIGVGKDSGAWLVFLGFWMALAGTAMLYFVIPKQVWARVDKTESGVDFYLAGASPRYRVSFAEHLDTLRAEIAAAPSDEKAVITHVTI